MSHILETTYARVEKMIDGKRHELTDKMKVIIEFSENDLYRFTTWLEYEDGTRRFYTPHILLSHAVDESNRLIEQRRVILEETLDAKVLLETKSPGLIAKYNYSRRGEVSLTVGSGA